MNDTIRKFFDQRNFLEVETPIAVISPGIEPHLEPFEITEIGPDRSHQRLFLHTSPEYAMKKILAELPGHIYQIARVFRNGERSLSHAPEFTLLECYRRPGTLEDLMDDVVQLVKRVADAVDGPWRPNAVRRLSISEAFLEVGLPDPIETPDVETFRMRLGYANKDDEWDALFFRALLEHVEPTFPSDRVTLLYGYPASMAALSRLHPDDPRVALRFEAYLGPLELGNAFAELSDPLEQRARFEADLVQRRHLDRICPPIDEDLLSRLPKIEASAGIAVGLDRLLMICLGTPSIQDVIPFAAREVD